MQLSRLQWELQSVLDRSQEWGHWGAFRNLFLVRREEGPMERGAYGEAPKHGTLPVYAQEGVAHLPHCALLFNTAPLYMSQIFNYTTSGC